MIQKNQQDSENSQIRDLAPSPPPSLGNRLHTRRAELKDRQNLLEITQFWHAKSKLSSIPFSNQKANALIDKAMGDIPSHIALVVEHDNRILGAAYVSIGEYFIGDGILIATIQGFGLSHHVHDSLLSGRVAIRLFQAIRRWSTHMKAAHILCHATIGFQSRHVDRFLQKLGGVPLGGNYVISNNKYPLS